MRAALLIVSACYFFSNQAVLAGQVSPSKLDTQLAIAKTDRYIQKIHTKKHIQGLSVSVLVNGRLLHQKSVGYADIESKVPISENTVFHIASITKLFVSLAVHELLLKHKVTVDSSIGEFLKEVPSQWKHIKIQELLSHTSGLPDYYSRNPYPKTVNEAIELVSLLPFDYQTGQKSQYIQTGFALLHLLIEKLSGMSLEAYLQFNHFDKFNLRKTHYQLASDNKIEASKAYRKTWTGVQPYNFDYPPSVYASAGLMASNNDLTHWLTALLNGQILSPDYLQRIWHVVPLKNGESSGFSLGWEYHESEKFIMVGHGGADTSEVRHFINKDSGNSITIIWLSNTLGVDPHKSLNIVASYFMEDVPL